MRTLARRSKPAQRTILLKSSKQSRAIGGQPRAGNPIRNLQHAMGNQAVMRLLRGPQGRPENSRDPVGLSGQPSMGFPLRRNTLHQEANRLTSPHQTGHRIQRISDPVGFVQRKDLPGGITTDDVCNSCIEWDVYAGLMEDDVLLDLYESLRHYYMIRDREGMPELEWQTLKGNIRGLRQLLQERGLIPHAGMASPRRGIAQASARTSSSENSVRPRPGELSRRLMRSPVPEAALPSVDAETLTQIAAENPYQGTRIQEVTRAPGLTGRVPLPIPYNQLDPRTVNLVDAWGLNCPPCRDVAQRIIVISRMPEFRNVRFYHLCVQRFPGLQYDYVPKVFILQGRGLRFQWDNRSPFDDWATSKLRLFA